MFFRLRAASSNDIFSAVCYGELVFELAILGLGYVCKALGAMCSKVIKSVKEFVKHCAAFETERFFSLVFTFTGSVTSRGIFPWYGEKCSSTMAVTFSSGDNDEPKIVRNVKL